LKEYSLPISKAWPQVGFSSSSSSYVVCHLNKNNLLESKSSSPITETDEDIDYEQSSPKAKEDERRFRKPFIKATSPQSHLFISAIVLSVKIALTNRMAELQKIETLEGGGGGDCKS
jgi:hypothetical protein